MTMRTAARLFLTYSSVLETDDTQVRACFRLGPVADRELKLELKAPRNSAILIPASDDRQSDVVGQGVAARVAEVVTRLSILERTPIPRS